MKTLNLYFKNLQLVFSFLLIFTLLSHPNYSFAQTILYGDSAALGNGVVRTFVQLNATGHRERIGLSMTDGVMNNLDTILRTFVLALPAPVVADDTTFNHVFFTWNPIGHGPPGIFELPHFDFHFVTVTVAERQSVIPGIDPVYYPQEFVPIDYLRDNFPPGVVPFRGLHWADSSLHTTNANFKNVLIYNTYRGKLFAFEPMITRAYLLTNPDTIIAIKQAHYYRRTGDYPQNYSINHNAVNHNYNVFLRDFEPRVGNTADPFIGISNAMRSGVPLGDLFCDASILGPITSSIDLDLTASDWDVGDSVTLAASFSPPLPIGSTFLFTPSLPARGYPARTHLHLASNGPYVGDLIITATDLTGNTTMCQIRFDFASPVELTSFVSTIHENNVTLNWTTATEDNNARFEIERANGSAHEWNMVGTVQGHGNSTQPISYSFVDRGMNAGTYNYRLKQIDFNGNHAYHNLSNEVIIGVPTRFSLSQNYPNPFNPKTIINYEVPLTKHVTINVYDISGKEVATLVNQLQSAGYYAIDFDGSNFASGVYFYKLVVDGNIIDTKRMLLLK